MKRFVLAGWLIAGLALSAFAAPQGGRSARGTKTPEPEILREIGPEEIQPGMRVKIRLRYGRPLIGSILRVTDKMVQLDLSTEPGGLPGKLKFRRTDIAQVHEVKPQTDQEKQRVRDQHRQKLLAIKSEVKARLEKRKAAEREEEESDESAQQAYREALDVVVAKEEEERMRALVEEFPPDQWGEARFRQIRENWILRDLMPTAKESRFVSVFEEWRQARDTVAVLDARQEEKNGETLLLRFPPSQGWGQSRLTEIAEKEAKGEPVTEKEAGFKESYEAWSKAVLRRAAEQPPQPAPEEKPPVEEKPAEGEPEETKPPAEDEKAD